MSLNTSTASDSKSKRSFNSMSNSNSSNNTRSNGSNRNKNRKTNRNQKTLGMAWGSNSRSSSRSVFRNSPFPDFGSYMVLKNQKLHQQFDAEALSSSRNSSSSERPIFQGVSIFVDGYTVPSSQELRGYMLKHGGRFENYFSRHRVTHIICSILPDSKIKNLRSFSGGLPVVKPTWVLDSVAANKLLSWIPYQLDQLASENDNQPKLAAFFSSKSSEVFNEFAEGLETSATGDSTLPIGLIVDSNFVGECESSERVRECSVPSDNVAHVNIAVRNFAEPTTCMGDQYPADLDDVAAVNGSNTGFKPQTSVTETSLSVCDNSLNIHKTEKSSSSKISRPASIGHSTLSDANFVENYFKYSRLHFIGTWRNRYRKRFPTMSNAFRNPGSSDNAFATSQKAAVIHVDMDCFFVSVVIRNRPDLKEKPVAVCHSDNPRGTAEISSANYPARDFGVKAGMFVRDAKALCPHLVIIPYDFKAYEEVADQFYEILHKHSNNIQAVSCDEAFVDVTDSGVEDPQLFASNIRKEILDTTRCTASAGMARNMLMARVATRIAKPNGQCYIPPEKVEDYLRELPVKALPGIGHVLEEKLKKRQVKTCGQLQLISKETLQKEFGAKTGDMLWNFSRGIDNRLVGIFQESKSIGAEVNWGVRFNDLNDTRKFIDTLCKEVSLRLQGCGVLGRTFTLKLKKRRNDAGEPVKYMGCGDCENLSRSITLPMATDDADVLHRITAQLFGYFHIDAKDIRGMGLQASKLESADNTKQGHEKNSIRSWLVSTPSRTRCIDNDISNQRFGGEMTKLRSGSGSPVQIDASLAAGEAPVNHEATIPALHDLDIGVIESLPPEVFSEINNLYAGKLMAFISKKKEKNVDTSQKLLIQQAVDGAINEEGSLFDTMIPSIKEEEIFRNDIIVESLPNSGAKNEEQPMNIGTSKFVISSPPLETNSLMPSSLSQVDPSVLLQLPEELKEDIRESLPPHRRPDLVSNDVSLRPTVNQTGTGVSLSSKDLWVGNPPRWVDDFRLGGCQMLKMFAVLFLRCGASRQLSSVLQRIMSEVHLPLAMGINGEVDVVSCLSELIGQYVRKNVETDIEEIYVCSLLLKRLAFRSKVFSHVYSNILPHLQAAVGENYGGNLNISFVE